MGATLLGTFAPDSPQWHEARMHGLGGSEIAAVLGLSKWESHFALWHRKQALIPRQALNPEMEWGTRLESAIRAKFADEHPELQVAPTGTWAHTERPWQIANPDALGYQRSAMTADQQLISAMLPEHTATVRATPSSVVEIKTARDDWEWGEPGTDDIPPYYLTQARWYLDVLDLDVCHVAVLIAGSDYREYVIRPDADDTALMRAAGAAFMASIAAGERPDIDAHDATWQAVRALNPRVGEGDHELDGDLALGYCTARQSLKEAETTAKQLASLVADAMGDARRARFQQVTVATRQVRGDGLPFLVAGRRITDLVGAE